MNTIERYPKYVEWLSTQDMHKDSRSWLSELEFIKDEQLFFNDIIKSYTPQLTDTKHYEESKKMVSKLIELEKKVDSLIDAIKIHERNLKIMVDGKDQPKEEEAYKKEHRSLIVNVDEFKHTYRSLKNSLFTLIKNILKQEKRLLR